MGMAPGISWRVTLLETPSGFALLKIQDRAFTEPKNLWAWFTEGKVAQHVICLLEFTKVDDKSVVWDSDGPGENLAYLIKKYCQDGTELIVEDKNIKDIIESKLGVYCIYDEYVVGELMWGLKNVLYDFVHQERDNITRQYLLPLCEGLKDCIRTFGFNISTEAIDAPFIASAGSLHRCDVTLDRRVKELREACDKLVPDIGIIEDIRLCAEVVAKILTPQLEPEWDFLERFPADVALKLKAADAAAQDAREKIDFSFYQYICCSLADIRRLPGLEANLLEVAKSLAERCDRQKLHIAEKRTYVEAAEGTSQERGCIDASKSIKKARTEEGAGVRS